MIRWIYAAPGEPLWLWPSEPCQSVMFYDAQGPFSPGFPPMSDRDWERLEKSQRERNSRC